MNTGNIIKKLRSERGLTQEKLSEITGIDAATIRKYENGQYPVTTKAATRFAEAFNVNPSCLIIQDINITSAMHILFFLFRFYGGRIKFIESKSADVDGNKLIQKEPYISFDVLNLLIRECYDRGLLRNPDENSKDDSFEVLEQFPASFEATDDEILSKCISIFDQWLETGVADYSAIGLDTYDPSINIGDQLANQLMDVMFTMMKKKEDN